MSTMWMEEKIHDQDYKEEIRKRVAGKTDLQLGKKGITENFIREVKNRLEKQGVVKIKILRSFRRSAELDRRDIARIVAEKTGARLVEVRGYTFILAKPRTRDKVKR
jgi:RNA-binding protein